MKIAFFYIILLSGTVFLQVSADAQASTFNKVYPLERPNTAYQKMALSDTTVYILGLAKDSLPPYTAGALLHRVDMQGNTLGISTYVDTNKLFYLSGELLMTHNNKFIGVYEVGDYADQDDFNKIFMICYSESGDTLFTRSYTSPYHYLFWVNDIVETPDHGYLILGKVKYQPTGDLQVYLLKTDSLGIKEWDQVYGDTEIDEFVSQLLPIENAQYLILLTRTNYHLTWENFVSRIAILKLDGQYEISEFWESDNSNLLLSGHLLVSDNHYLITGGLGKEIPINANTATMKTKGYVFSLDNNMNQEWSIIFQDSTFDHYTYLRKSIPLSDGSGHLACGTVHEITYEPGPQSNINGWVVKFTESGDSLWSRYFHYWDTPYDEHYFYDMEEMPDGSVLLCGQAISGDSGPQQQVGWLVKLDEFGCLVPGCQLVAAHQPEVPEVSLLLYPNPASDILNIYTWSPYTPKNAVLRIVSSSGQVVRESPVTRSDVTSMIPVRDLAAGVYFVQYVAGGVVVATEEAVIAR
jgi:hypothetical protein